MNSSIHWIFLWRLPIQNHWKPFITEKRRNKAKYPTWNSVSLKSVKETSMSNSVKSLGYIKCYRSSSPRPVKSLRFTIDREDLRTYWKSGKQDSFRHLLKSSASLYESSGSQLFKTTTGIQSRQDAFDESRSIMNFLTILGVIEICRFR